MKINFLKLRTVLFTGRYHPMNCSSLPHILSDLLILNILTWTLLEAPLALAKPQHHFQHKDGSTGLIEAYKQCRKKVIAESASQTNPKLRRQLIKRGSSNCKKRYPKISNLIGCRKKALKDNIYGKNDLYLALKACMTTYELQPARTSTTNPLTLDGKTLWFSNINLSEARSFSPLKKKSGGTPSKPNDALDCTNVYQVLKGTSKPEYILFGNDPRSFQSLRKKTFKSLLKSLKINRKKKRSKTLNPYLGQLVWHKKSSSLAAYFPVAACSVTQKQRGNFQDIKIYYLLDKKKSVGLPYFGIAFYQSQDRVSPSRIIWNLKKILGTGYIHKPIANDIQAVSRGEITEFDYEGDPFNMCKAPRTHSIIATVKPNKSKKHTDFVLVANIRNLCHYGDTMAKRWKMSSSKEKK